MYFSIDIAAAHAYQWLGPRPNLKLSRPSLQYVLQGLKVEIWWPPLLTKGVSVSVLNVAISVLHPESKLSVSSSSVSRRFCKVSVSMTSPTYQRGENSARCWRLPHWRNDTSSIFYTILAHTHTPPSNFKKVPPHLSRTHWHNQPYFSFNICS